NGVGVARIGLFAEQAAGAGIIARPVRPPGLDTGRQTSWSQLRNSGNVFAPPPGHPDSPVTIHGTLESDLTVSLVVRGPGRLTATANGRPIPFNCHTDPGNLLGCSPGGPLGWTVTTDSYGPLARVDYALENLSGLSPGTPITITVTPTGFAGDDW